MQVKVNTRGYKNETLQVISCFLTGTSSVQSVTSKVGTPVSLTAQRFTVQIPAPSQTATTKTSKIILRIKIISIFNLDLNDIIRTLGNSMSVLNRFSFVRKQLNLFVV